MKIEFCKIGERRYAIKILRDNFPDLEMNPAPGFDDLMPHDMCHLIVEQVLSIDNGIFGRIAKGGTAGSFRNPPSETVNTKKDSRQRRKDKEKGKKIAKQNSDDLAKSERATYVCWQNWLSRSDDLKLKQRAEEMKEDAEIIRMQMSDAERAIYTKENLARVRARMDELSAIWRSLSIGEKMLVEE